MDSDAGTPAESHLQRQLQENQAQRTEITGYINQLNIQLHRWQLRLQQLEARRQELESQAIAQPEAKTISR